MKAEADAILKWLTLGKNGRWLMIFDNVDLDMRSDDEDTQAYSVTSFLPAADHDSVLITTRLPSLGEIGESTEVRRLGLDQALELLSNRSGLPRSSSDMKKLIQRLGYLPLALVQAGTYMRETKTGCSKYLHLYETSWSRLLAEIPRLCDYENGSIQTTWMIAYNRLRDSEPAAAKLLQLWAYLDRQDIWYELFSRGSAGCRECEWLHNLAQSEIKFKGVMRSLLAYSLIESHQYTESYSIHPVVHDWCAETISDGKGDLVATALSIVGTAAPHDGEADYWLLQQRLLPHADRCIRKLDEFDLLDQLGPVEASDAFHNLGVLYYDQGKITEAEKIYRRALDGKEKAYGPNCPFTLETANNLGHCYARRDEYAEAEKMYQRALYEYEKLLGPDHPSIFQTLNYLGFCYARQGEYTEAENMYRRALVGYEKIGGLDNPLIFLTLNELGLLYADRSEYTEAEKLLRRALDGLSKNSRSIRPFTFHTINNLGLVHSFQDNYTEAKEMFEQALVGKVTVYGPNYLFTLETLYNLRWLQFRRRKQAQKVFYGTKKSNIYRMLRPRYL
ncbi:MAG: hypothetical protein Q9181_007645 [Wetmoreana brouardii]